MTQKAATPSWDRRLSGRDRKRIARTLSPLRDGVDLAKVLDDIERHMQWYCYCREPDHIYGRESRKQIASKFVQIAECADQLLHAIDSLGKDGHLQLRLRLGGGRKLVSLRRFRYYMECLRSAVVNFDPRGRPRDDILSIYVAELVMIYADATGTRARRQYNRYRRNQGEAERLPFFAACMAAAGVAKYPTRIIRQMLDCGDLRWYPAGRGLPEIEL
jgi:hypothetical protein